MIATIIYNIIVILVLGGLSIYFKKWWIILFAYLLTLTYKYHDDSNENAKDNQMKNKDEK